MDITHYIYAFNSCTMFSLALYSICYAFRCHPEKRLIRYMVFHTLITSSLTYLGLFFDLGIIQMGDYVLFYTRYVEWMISTAAQLISLGIIGCLTISNIYIIVLFDELMLITGLLSEIFRSINLCGSIILACLSWLFYFPIAIFLFEELDYNKIVFSLGKFTADQYLPIGRSLMSVWFLYPIVWMLYWLQILSVKYIDISYSVLDFFAKCGFAIWLLVCTDRFEDKNKPPIYVLPSTNVVATEN